MNYEIKYGKDARLVNAKNFNLEQIFDCGQCFRFNRDESYDGIKYIGVAFGRLLSVYKDGSDIVFENVTRADFEKIWYPFFDMDTDYGAIINGISDAHCRKCAEYGEGIRILRQDPWETVCSFIISQNNNIPRIKKIIGTISEKFGESFDVNGKTYYAFPSAESLYNAGQEAIFECRTGFRAKYIFDAAKRVVTGELDLEKAKELSDTELAEELMKIKGVGPKVAACAGLFGFSHFESFPVDVWIKRVIDKYYGKDFDPAVFGKYAGICQQYLFYYERSLTEDD